MIQQIFFENKQLSHGTVSASSSPLLEHPSSLHPRVIQPNSLISSRCVFPGLAHGALWLGWVSTRLRVQRLFLPALQVVRDLGTHENEVGIRECQINTTPITHPRGRATQEAKIKTRSLLDEGRVQPIFPGAEISSPSSRQPIRTGVLRASRFVLPTQNDPINAHDEDLNVNGVGYYHKP